MLIMKPKTDNERRPAAIWIKIRGGSKTALPDPPATHCEVAQPAGRGGNRGIHRRLTDRGYLG